jgi:hypothetical protein
MMSSLFRSGLVVRKRTVGCLATVNSYQATSSRLSLLYVPVPGSAGPLWLATQVLVWLAGRGLDGASGTSSVAVTPVGRAEWSPQATERSPPDPWGDSISGPVDPGGASNPRWRRLG